MKVSKKIVAMLVVGILLFSYFAFPVKNIVLAYDGDSSNLRVCFEGDGLIVNDDGTINVNSNLEYNTGVLNIALYNPDNSQVQIKPRQTWNNESGTNVNVPGEAEGELSVSSYNGVYLKISSSNVNLNDVKLTLDHEYLVEDIVKDNNTGISTGKINLSSMSWNSGIWINLDNNLTNALEKKEVTFRSEGLQITEDGEAIIKCDLDYNSGTIKVGLFNADGSRAIIRKNTYWGPKVDSEGNPVLNEGGEPIYEEYESDTDGRAMLKINTYAGAYLKISSVSGVNINDIKLDFGYDENTYEEIYGVIDDEGRVYFPSGYDDRAIFVETDNLREAIEKKEININDDNLEIDGNTVTITSNLKQNSGKINISIFNADGTEAIIKNRTSWVQKLDEEGNEILDEFGYPIWEEQIMQDSAVAKLNSTTYKDSFFVVDSDDGVDIYNLAFYLAGHRVTVDSNGRAYLPDGIDNINLSSFQLEYAIPRATTEIYCEEGLTLNQDGSVSIPCYVENNAGIVKMFVYNKNGDKVELEKAEYWNIELQDFALSDNTVTGEFNTPLFTDGYLRFESEEGVDLSKILVDIWGKRKPIGADGKVDLFVEDEDANVLDYFYFEPEMFHGNETNDISGTISVQNGGITELYINGTRLSDSVTNINVNDETGVTSAEWNQIAIEKKTVDRIEMESDWGYVFSEVKINGIQQNIEQENSYWFEVDIPHSDSYSIEVKLVRDESILPEIMWSYEDISDGEEEWVKNGHIDLISVTIPGQDGEDDLVITAEDIGRLVDEPGMGMHYIYDEARLRDLYDDEGNVVGKTLSVKKNAIVRLRITPDDGYMFLPDRVSEISLVPDKENVNEYTFVVPDIVSYSFGDVMAKTELFKDTLAGSWYMDSIKYVVNNGMMNGYTSGNDAGKFGPDDSITRGQIVTILYRREGQPAVSGNLNFKDKNDSSLWSANYYNNAILWASKNGIVTGYKDGENAGRFLPDKPISRAELAVILQRYANYKGKNTTATVDLSRFSDRGEVANWAKSGVEWVISKGIITGDMSTGSPLILPQGNATRAAAATMIMRFCQNVK